MLSPHHGLLFSTPDHTRKVDLNKKLKAVTIEEGNNVDIGPLLCVPFDEDLSALLQTGIVILLVLPDVVFLNI